MRKFVIGDIHGGYKALIQVLERANFDYENDLLISIGDIVDGWSQSFECVEELLKIKNLIAIKGNHDETFLKWLETGVNTYMWAQGGIRTAESYARGVGFPMSSNRTYELDAFGKKSYVYTINMFPEVVPDSHRKFFKYQHRYYIDPDKNIFVHAGFDRRLPFKQQTHDPIYWWDRELFNQALSAHGRNQLKFADEDIREIFIGHTSTMNWEMDVPMKADRIWNIDTGGGYAGRLTMMEVDTKEIYQSDFLRDLYPDELDRD